MEELKEEEKPSPSATEEERETSSSIPTRKKTHLENELEHLNYISCRTLDQLFNCITDQDLVENLPYCLASLGHMMYTMSNVIRDGSELFSERFNELQRRWRHERIREN
jgi:hypothetical protein